MTDVRSLLRNERAARHISHPHASYSATGKLECLACRVSLKSDIETWNKHLRSPQHMMRAERLRVSSGKPADLPAATRVPEANPSDNNKKRKAVEDEDEVEDPRKKNKQGIASPGRSLQGSTDTHNSSPPLTEMKPPPPIAKGRASGEALDEPERLPKSVDEDEWAAFERDIARPASPEAPSALNAEANITANPVKAAENATSAQEVDIGARDQRALEAEAEREDAARALEEEFEEMEGLEERVKRLRDKREALRSKQTEETNIKEGQSSRGSDHSLNDDGNDDDEDDELEDDFDNWNRWGQ